MEPWLDVLTSMAATSWFWYTTLSPVIWGAGKEGRHRCWPEAAPLRAPSGPARVQCSAMVPCHCVLCGGRTGVLCHPGTWPLSLA